MFFRKSSRAELASAPRNRRLHDLLKHSPKKAGKMRETLTIPEAMDAVNKWESSEISLQNSRGVFPNRRLTEYFTEITSKQYDSPRRACGGSRDAQQPRRATAVMYEVLKLLVSRENFF